MPSHRRLLCAPFLMALLAATSGCATMMSQLSYAAGGSADNMFPPSAVIYGGTRCHCGILIMASTNARLTSQPSAAPALLFVLLDMPLSLIADTLLLPITIVEWALLDPDDGDAANEKAQQGEPILASASNSTH